MINLFVAVCSEEESCGNLGLQGLWKSESRRCLHLEVILFYSLPSNIVFSLICQLTAYLFLNSTASAVTVRSTIRRLREQTEG